MLTGGRGGLVVQDNPYLDGYVIQFSSAGNWFYTPDDPPQDIEGDATSERIERKSRNFATKEEALAFGMGFEKEVSREL